MQFTSEKGSFFQCGYNFYVGDIVCENTIVFKDDFIIIGKINTNKNIFALGELIVFGDIKCKSIYASKDFVCIGDVHTESIEVEGKSKIIQNKKLEDQSTLGMINELQILKGNNARPENIIVNNENKNTVKEKIDVNKCTENIDLIKDNDESEKGIVEVNKKQDINLTYEKYLNKKGDIVLGKVVRLEKNNYIVKLDDIEAYLPITNEENFKINDIIGAYIQSVNMDEDILNVKLAQNNRSYITKIIKKEMEVNKYDVSKIYIKSINKISRNKYVVEILSQYHTQSSLDIISNKLKKYTNGKTIELKLYENNKNEEITKISKTINNGTINIISIKGFYIGDEIYHKKFGKGKVLSIKDKNVAKIDFNGVEKDLDLTYLLNNGFISKSDIYSKDNTKSTKFIDKSKNNLSIDGDISKIVEKYKNKKFTLIEGIVSDVKSQYIKFDINNEVVGILKREHDSSEDIAYTVGQKVICYISKIYINDGKVEAQIYRNTSNFFKLLFNKYKQELDLNNFKVKFCKYTKDLGVKIVVERRNVPDDYYMLDYIRQLMIKDVGVDIIKIVLFQYSPYKLLSELLDIPQSSIKAKEGIYYVTGISKENLDSIKYLLSELSKVVGYNIKVEQ